MILLMCTAFLCNIDAAGPELKTSPIAASCFGKADGSISLVYSGNPVEPIKLSVIDSTNKIILNLTLINDTTFQINHLFPGKYKIHYLYNRNPISINIIIENKPQLKANIICIKELSGTGSDIRATLEVKPTGGTTPYKIQWSENTRNQQGEYAKDLPQGIYRCFINDSNNCGPVSATFFLYETEIEKFKQNTKSNN
jgi:hypothetical protein